MVGRAGVLRPERKILGRERTDFGYKVDRMEKAERLVDSREVGVREEAWWKEQRVWLERWSDWGGRKTDGESEGLVVGVDRLAEGVDRPE